MRDQLITEEELEEIWENHGLKQHVERLHKYLLSHGLQPMAVPAFVFVGNLKQKILVNFLVKGVSEDSYGRQTFPKHKDRDGSGEE